MSRTLLGAGGAGPIAAAFLGMIISCSFGCQSGTVQVTPTGSAPKGSTPNGQANGVGGATAPLVSKPNPGLATQVFFPSAEIHGGLPTRVEGVAFLPVRARTSAAYRLRLPDALDLTGFSGLRSQGQSVRFLVPQGDGSRELHELNIRTLELRNLGPATAEGWPETDPTPLTSLASVTSDPRLGSAALRLELPSGERTVSLGIPASLSRWVCPVVSGEWVYYADRMDNSYVIARLNLGKAGSAPEIFAAPASDDLGYLCPALGPASGGNSGGTK